MTTIVSFLDHTVLDAHNRDTGRYDALRIAGVLAIPVEEIAQALEYTARGIRNNPDSVRLQPQLERLMRLVTRLRSLLEGSIEYTRIWLKSPHPDLGLRTPLSYILDGKIEVVETLVEMIETGQPG